MSVLVTKFDWIDQRIRTVEQEFVVVETRINYIKREPRTLELEGPKTSIKKWKALKKTFRISTTQRRLNEIAFSDVVGVEDLSKLSYQLTMAASWTIYQKQFVAAATANRWSEQDKATLLMMVLRCATLDIRGYSPKGYKILRLLSTI